MFIFMEDTLSHRSHTHCGVRVAVLHVYTCILTMVGVAHSIYIFT